eukprot:gene44333-56223_t
MTALIPYPTKAAVAMGCCLRRLNAAAAREGESAA